MWKINRILLNLLLMFILLGLLLTCCAGLFGA